MILRKICGHFNMVGTLHESNKIIYYFTVNCILVAQSNMALQGARDLLPDKFISSGSAIYWPRNSYLRESSS